MRHAQVQTLAGIERVLTMRAPSIGTISSVTGSHSAAPGSRKVTVCENEPEGMRAQEPGAARGTGGVYIKRGAESHEARCHDKKRF